jgi:hypothetical protein
MSFLHQNALNEFDSFGSVPFLSKSPNQYVALEPPQDQTMHWYIEAGWKNFFLNRIVMFRQGNHSNKPCRIDRINSSNTRCIFEDGPHCISNKFQLIWENTDKLVKANYTNMVNLTYSTYNIKSKIRGKKIIDCVGKYITPLITHLQNTNHGTIIINDEVHRYQIITEKHLQANINLYIAAVENIYISSQFLDNFIELIVTRNPTELVVTRNPTELVVTRNPTELVSDPTKKSEMDKIFKNDAKVGTMVQYVHASTLILKEHTLPKKIAKRMNKLNHAMIYHKLGYISYSNNIYTFSSYPALSEHINKYITHMELEYSSKQSLQFSYSIKSNHSFQYKKIRTDTHDSQANIDTQARIDRLSKMFDNSPLPDNPFTYNKSSVIYPPPNFDISDFMNNSKRISHNNDNNNDSNNDSSPKRQKMDISNCDFIPL